MVACLWFWRYDPWFGASTSEWLWGIWIVELPNLGRGHVSFTYAGDWPNLNKLVETARFINITSRCMFGNISSNSWIPCTGYREVLKIHNKKTGKKHPQSQEITNRILDEVATKMVERPPAPQRWNKTIRFGYERIKQIVLKPISCHALNHRHQKVKSRLFSNDVLDINEAIYLTHLDQGLSVEKITNAWWKKSLTSQ